ncbi:MAG: ABC transporter ATP-binding protein/permease [Anaerolineae bacterium]|nr:ABC transporter ATP-binding protein/permease [Anaerolineae bacterium]
MKSLRKLLPFLKPYRWHMLTVILATLGVTVTNLIHPWLIRTLIQIVSDQTSTQEAVLQTVTGLAAVLLTVFVLRSFSTFLKSYIAHVMAWSVVSDMRVALYGHLQRLSPRFYADRQTGELLARVIKDTTDIEPLIAHYIPDLIVNILVIIGIAAILFSLDPVLAALTLIPIPLLVMDGLFFGHRMNNGFRSAARGLGTLSAVIQDNLTGIKEIQIFTQENREHSRVDELSQTNTRDRLYALKMMGIMHPSIELIGAIGMVIVVLFGGRAAVMGQLPIEDVVAFILYLGLFYQPVTQLAQMQEQLTVGLTAIERVNEVMDLEPDVKDMPRSVDPGRVTGRITFDNVSFDYQPDAATLRNVSLAVEPGQTLALVGPTGAGKSTIASLIPRFYDPQLGSIMIDGVDVRDIQLSALRRNISMVLQDVFLFNGSVRDNIRYSNLSASNEEVIAAAKAANIHEFVASLPEGYDTQIGERGVRLSGGQKQRIAIARAVLKDAPILILDEATSAVDTQTEIEIQEALNRLMKGRTSIVIAHRLSTIRNADQIAVLEDGCIVEQGRHHELVQHEGLYNRLHEASMAL